MAYTEVKTPIVYYGGKTAIWPHIEPMIPEHVVYTETFFGGGTVFWAKKPAINETINDRLEVVVNFYQQLKLNYRGLKRLIDASLISRDLHYYGLSIIRAHVKKEKVNKIELAWAFWFCTNFAYSNKLGGGLKHANDKGTCVPKILSNKKEFFTELLVERIESAHIENTDAIKVLNTRNAPYAFHYLDPPYENADQGHYSGYKELEPLLDWCANECKGLFLLSNYNSDLLTEYVEKYGWYKKQIEHRIQAPRKSGGSKIEVLVSNYKNGHQTLDLFNH